MIYDICYISWVCEGSGGCREGDGLDQACPKRRWSDLCGDERRDGWGQEDGGTKLAGERGRGFDRDLCDVRGGVLRRIFGRLGGDPGAVHAVDERHQRD